MLSLCALPGEQHCKMQLYDIREGAYALLSVSAMRLGSLQPNCLAKIVLQGLFSLCTGQAHRFALS